MVWEARSGTEISWELAADIICHSFDCSASALRACGLFLPYFFPISLLSCHTPIALADTMRLISAYLVEQDRQRDRREEREQQLQSDVERVPERARVKPIPFRV